MGENSTTLGDQVGSPRVVPILRFRTRFLHIRRIFVRFRHSHSHSHTTLKAQWFAILGFWDFGILGFCASIGKHDVIIHGDVDCQPGGGGIDVRHVCHYFHTPISQEVETARQNMFGNTAHVVLVLWMQKLRFPSARTPDFTAPSERARRSHTYTRYRQPKVCM